MYRIEGLHPPRAAMAAAVLRTAVKETDSFTSDSKEVVQFDRNFVFLRHFRSL